MDIVTYALCKKLAAAAVSGIKNLTIQGTDLIIETTDGNTLTMNFPVPADGKDGIDGKDGKDGLNGKDGRDGIDGKDGLNGKDGIDGKDGADGQDGSDGLSIINVEVNSENHIICTLSDNSTIDAGPITLKDIQDGVDGISVTNVQIDENNHLICTMSDGSTIDAGEISAPAAAADGLIQIDTFDNLPTVGKTNVIYLTLDTETIYYFSSLENKYKSIITSGQGSSETHYWATEADIDKLFSDDPIVYPDVDGLQFATEQDVDNLFKDDEGELPPANSLEYATEQDVNNLFKEEETK